MPLQQGRSRSHKKPRHKMAGYVKTSIARIPAYRLEMSPKAAERAAAYAKASGKAPILKQPTKEATKADAIARLLKERKEEEARKKKIREKQDAWLYPGTWR